MLLIYKAFSYFSFKGSKESSILRIKGLEDSFIGLADKLAFINGDSIEQIDYTKSEISTS